MASVNSRQFSAITGIERKHFCPTCDAPVKRLVMQMPGRSMWGTCENGHAHRKVTLILR